jgi:hypothetical protein
MIRKQRRVEARKGSGTCRVRTHRPSPVHASLRTPKHTKFGIRRPQVERSAGGDETHIGLSGTADVSSQPMAARPASRWRPAVQPGSSSSVGSPAAALCTSLRAALHGTWRECRPRLTISPFPLTDDRRPYCGGYLVMTAGDAAHSDLSAGPCVPTPRTGPALACKRCPHNSQRVGRRHAERLIPVRVSARRTVLTTGTK